MKHASIGQDQGRCRRQLRNGLTRRRRGRRLLSIAVTAGAVVAVGCVAAPEAEATQLLSFEEPYVVTQVSSLTSGDTDFDLTYNPLSLVAKGALSYASDPSGNYGLGQALANTDGPRGYSALGSVVSPQWAQRYPKVIAQSSMNFTTYDPLGRDRVKAVLEFTAAASAGTLPGNNDPAAGTLAWFFVEVGEPANEGQARRDDSGTTTITALPDLRQPTVCGASGSDSVQYGANVSKVSIYAHGQEIESHTSSGSVGYSKKIEMNVPAGAIQVVNVGVTVNGNGVAYIDPVIRPHPDNPEVVVTLHGAHDPTQTTLALPPAEELTAAGIDVAPLSDLGLFDVEQPCTGGTTLSGPKLLMTSEAAGSGKLRFQGKLTLPSPLDPPFDPIVRGARVRLADASAHAILDETVPGGALDPTTSIGWRHDTGRNRWIYSHPGASGLRHLVLIRAGESGNVYRFVARARLASTALPGAEQLPLTGMLVIDAPVAHDGQCGEAHFGGGSPATACPVHDGARLVCH